MKKIVLPIFSLALLFSCGGSDSNDANIESDHSDTDIESLVEKLEIDINLNKIEEVPNECEFEGKMLDAYTWVDENGKNYFLRTLGEYQASEESDAYSDEMGTQYLYAYQYTELKKGEFTLLKETIDFVKECEFDLIISHELDAITLTDLDENNIGEISFIYRMACTSDVSPSTQKLIMLENGNKYPLRGVTMVMEEGGNYEVGDEFESAPESFLKHAEKLWSEHLLEYDFEL